MGRAKLADVQAVYGGPEGRPLGTGHGRADPHRRVCIVDGSGASRGHCTREQGRGPVLLHGRGHAVPDEILPDIAHDGCRPRSCSPIEPNRSYRSRFPPRQRLPRPRSPNRRSRNRRSPPPPNPMPSTRSMAAGIIATAGPCSNRPALPVRRMGPCGRSVARSRFGKRQTVDFDLHGAQSSAETLSFVFRELVGQSPIVVHPCPA